MSYSSKRRSSKNLEKTLQFDEYFYQSTDEKENIPSRNPNNCYDILGITPNCTPITMKKAYKAAIIRDHPDKGGNTQQFNQVYLAYQILKNNDTKLIHDEYGQKTAEIYHDYINTQYYL